jgi:hypothetical protein
MAALLDVACLVAGRVLARRPLSVSFSGVFSFVASRVSARRPIYFLLLRQKKVAQEKATRVRVTLRCAKGSLRCSRRAGNLQTRLSPQTCSLLNPPAAALLGTRTREWKETSPRVASVCGESGSPLPSRWCEAPVAAPGIPVPQLPCGCAEQRSGARNKRAACLSPQGEFAARPRFASSAGCPGAQHRGRRHQGRLSFAYFSLAKQRKVRRLPGRNPACHANKNTS